MKKIERLATPEESERVLIDIWSSSTGLTETMTLSEACRRNPPMQPWIYEYLTPETPRDAFFRVLNMGDSE